MGTRACAYARISHDPSGKELGVQRQMEACRRLAESRGLTITAEYVENDTSAFHGDRPKFAQMLQDLDQFDAILVWAPDRLYRQLRDLERLVTVLGSTPVFSVVSGDLDLSTADGRLHARIVGSVASHESERKGERVKAAKQQAIARGQWVGVPPRGYIREAGVMRLDPEMAPRVAEAAQSVLAGGSIHGAARSLGIAPASMRALFQSPAIAGLTSRREPGKWEAIVPEGDWWRLQALLSDRKRPDRKTPRSAGLSLLGGIATCSHGSPLHIGGNGAAQPMYRAARCAECNTTIQRDVLDAQVTEWVLAKMADPTATSAFQAPEQTTDFKRVEALKARRKALAGMVADELLTEEDAREQLRAIKDELSSLESAARPGVVLDSTDPEVVAAVWNAKAMTVEKRRSLIRLLCTVTVLPGVRGHLSKDRVQITSVSD